MAAAAKALGAGGGELGGGQGPCRFLVLANREVFGAQVPVRSPDKALLGVLPVIDTAASVHQALEARVTLPPACSRVWGRSP